MKTSIICAMCVALTAIGFGQVSVVTPTPMVQQFLPSTNEIPVGATIPRVVSSIPYNTQEKVNRNLREIQITFDQPMDVATFYLPISGTTTDWPPITDEIYWTNGNRTLHVPVSLGPNTVYRIPINVTNQVFRSAKGVVAQQGYITFSTGGATGGSSTNPATLNNKWQNQRSFSSNPTPGIPSGGSSSRGGGVSSTNRSRAMNSTMSPTPTNVNTNNSSGQNTSSGNKNTGFGRVGSRSPQRPLVTPTPVR